MQAVKPTFARALMLFAAFAWRCALYTALGVLVGGVALGVLFFALNVGAQQREIVLAVATYLITAPAMFLAAQHCLGSRIGDFRIMLVKAE